MDTIGLIINRADAPNTNFLKVVPQYLTELYNKGNEVFIYDIPTIKGKLENFKLDITNDKIKIYDGSLQKFFEGNNISHFGLEKIKQGFELLGDRLHLSIYDAQVYKFHFARAVTLNNDANLYLAYLGGLHRYKRLEQPTGILYRNAYRGLCLYNKIAELKNKREYIPPLYKHTNLLRIEMRYNKRICSYFNIPKITPKELINEDFYIRLCNDLYKHYNSIAKLKKDKIDMENVRTKEQLKRVGVLSLIEREGGLLEALQDVKERQTKGLITKKQAFDLRQLLKECSQDKLHTIESDLIVELNKKVKESIAY